MADYKPDYPEKRRETLSKKSAESLKDMLDGKSFMQASMDVMRLLPVIIQAEAPYKDQLEKLAEEVVRKEYKILNTSKVKIDAKIVGPGELNLNQSDGEEATEEDVEEFFSKSEADKRYIIDGITAGASIDGTKSYYLFADILDLMGEELRGMYDKLVTNSYGIYDSDEAIAMMLAMMSQNSASQGGESEVDWNAEEGTITIKAQAVCFPILIHEIVKGLYELIALKGSTDDPEKNRQIMAKVGRAINEPAALRYGKFDYRALAQLVIDSPYDPAEIRELFFQEVYELPATTPEDDPQTTVTFNNFVYNALENDLTPVEQAWVQRALKKANDKAKRNLNQNR